jgi:hypothetical protein
MASGDRDQFYLLGPAQQIPPEDRDRIKSPKRRVLDNVQNCVSYINIPSSQTYR